MNCFFSLTLQDLHQLRKIWFTTSTRPPWPSSGTLRPTPAAATISPTGSYVGGAAGNRRSAWRAAGTWRTHRSRVASWKTRSPSATCFRTPTTRLRWKPWTACRTWAERRDSLPPSASLPVRLVRRFFYYSKCSWCKTFFFFSTTWKCVQMPCCMTPCSQRFLVCCLIGSSYNAATTLLCLICTAARYLRARVISHGCVYSASHAVLTSVGLNFTIYLASVFLQFVICGWTCSDAVGINKVKRHVMWGLCLFFFNPARLGHVFKADSWCSYYPDELRLRFAHAEVETDLR